jgi:hypothetical protein
MGSRKIEWQFQMSKTIFILGSKGGRAKVQQKEIQV